MESPAGLKHTLEKVSFPIIYTLLGTISIVAQVIIIRKFLTTFYGNELTVGIILAVWMMWTGVGSILLGRFSDSVKRPYELLSVILIAISILITFTILFLLKVRYLFHLSASEIVGPQKIILISIVATMPLCTLIGFSFSLCSKLSDERSGIRVGKVFFFESCGSAFGGLFYHWFGTVYLNHLQISLFIIILTCGVVVSCLTKNNNIRYVCISFIIVLLPAALFGGDAFRKLASRMRWEGFNLIYSSNSRYSDIVLTKNLGEFTVFTNSSPLFTYPDMRHFEYMSHIGMIEHPNPKDILVVGGTISGIAEQLLKYPVEHIDFIQMDPAISETEKRYIPNTMNMLRDPRIDALNIDGRFFIKHAKRRSYDVIILDLPDPTNSNINRFYTLEFFYEAKEALKNKGIVVFSAGQTENYISKAQAQFLASIFLAVKDVFNKVIILPLDNNYFIASEYTDYITDNPTEINKRMVSRKVDTSYFRNYYTSFDLSERRLNFIKTGIEKAIKDSKTALTNTDMKPKAYFFDTVLWSSHFDNYLSDNIDKFKLSFNKLIVLLFIYTEFIFICILFSPLRKRCKNFFVPSGIFLVSFMSISMEVVVVIAFQTIHGYLYYKISLIITLFMVGLAAGVYLFNSFPLERCLKDISGHNIIFYLLIFCFILYNIVLIFLIRMLYVYPFSVLISELILFVSLFLGAMLCGMVFQSGIGIYIGNDRQTGKMAGIINGADHIGASVGGILTSIFFVPAYGIENTLLLNSITGILFIGNSYLYVSLFDGKK